MKTETLNADGFLHSRGIVGTITTNPTSQTKQDKEKVATEGTLNQAQANIIAQQIYNQYKTEMLSKFSEGYVSPTVQWLEQLSKSGYGYKKVAAATPQLGVMSTVAIRPTPEHGEAVKKEVKPAKQDKENAATEGTLNQAQANIIAQQIYNQYQEEMLSKFAKGYVSPTVQWLEQLSKSGYEYKKVAAATPQLDVMSDVMSKVAIRPTSEHGEAVKKEVKPVVVESVAQAVEEKKEVKEDSHVVLYVSLGLLTVAAVVYFGYSYIAKKAEKKHH